jgi:carboxyl-terminal processing protease
MSMLKTLNLALAIFIFCGAAIAQTSNKYVQDAFMLSRMVEKYHVQPLPLNDALSAQYFSNLLLQLDEEKALFTKEDIDKFSAYKYKLDDEVRTRQGAFLQLLTNTFKLRLQQADTMVENICKTPFNFSSKEIYTATEDTSYAANTAALRVKLYKILKRSVLEGILDFALARRDAKMPSQKMIDSLEPGLRKKTASTSRRAIKRTLLSPSGLESVVGNTYVHALAICYDPHSAYLTHDLKNQFEGELGKKTMDFGLLLGEDDDGNVQIGGLQPGSSAFQSGQLNEGDKIISVQWDKNEPIDVSTASLEEIADILNRAGQSKVMLNVKKADGTYSQAALQKAEVATAVDEDRVKGFILNGAKKIGYISLPAFYTDYENENNVNGCANDLAKEIIKLKKENIQGLVLDLRYNGGGSMQEAIDLAGLFIDAGPVAQVKGRGEKVTSLKDANRGMVYDGPLLLLVNGFSASASEMLAGTLQDYNRALVLGSPTFGKATMQMILPMDTTVDMDNHHTSNADTYVKITISKFYRLNGSSAQLNGVQPQVLVPDPADALGERESAQPNALKAPNIEANKYYKPIAALNTTGAQELAKKEMENIAWFKELSEYITTMKALNKPRDKSLNMQEAWLLNKDGKVGGFSISVDAGTQAGFSVMNHAYEQQRLNASKDLEEISKEWKMNIQTDPYVHIAFKVLSSIIK